MPFRQPAIPPEQEGEMQERAWRRIRGEAARLAERDREVPKRLGGGQPPSFPWHARPQSHEIQDFLSNLGFSKEFCDPCLGHDTIWRPGQQIKVYVDNINM